MELFLIRHPEPAVPEGTCYGRSDIGLAGDAGTEAARLRGMLPAGIPVYTSPLLRCRSVAEQLSPAPAVDDRLVEMHFGEWEMRRWDEIEKAAFDAWVADILNFAPPGGESAAMLQARVVDCVESLRGPRCALVTHAGVIRAVLGHWLQLPVDEWSQLALDFGSVTLIDVEPGAAAVLRFINR